MMHMRRAGISPAIFRAYDIRGIYPSEIDERAAYLIARAFAHQVRAMQSIAAPRSSQSEVGRSGKNIRILVSSDARQSSPSLKESFIKGLIEEGAHVIDAGLTTTPMHTFIVNRIGADGGAMITASHNPSQFNGIKLTGPQGTMGAGFGMEEIARMAQRGIFKEGTHKGTVREKNFLSAYIDFLIDTIPSVKKAKLNIALDSGNGMTELLLRPLLARLSFVTPFFLHNTIDMTFPHHPANPERPENVRDLQKEIKKGGYDFGAAFDGDGDRVGFVDERGEMIPGDLIIALFANRFIEKQGDAIVYEVRSSRVVQEEIERLGGKPYMTRAGYSFIKPMMRNHNAAFGGEASGHYMFRDFFFAESALLAFLTLLDIITKKKKKLGALMAPLRRYKKPPEINFVIANKEGAMDCVAAAFSDATISYLDGITVSYPHWWFNLRPSNTENLLRLNIEADTQKILEAKQRLVLNCLKKYIK